MPLPKFINSGEGFFILGWKRLSSRELLTAGSADRGWKTAPTNDTDTQDG